MTQYNASFAVIANDKDQPPKAFITEQSLYRAAESKKLYLKVYLSFRWRSGILSLTTKVYNVDFSYYATSYCSIVNRHDCFKDVAPKTYFLVRASIVKEILTQTFWLILRLKIYSKLVFVFSKRKLSVDCKWKFCLDLCSGYFLIQQKVSCI